MIIELYKKTNLKIMVSKRVLDIILSGKPPVSSDNYTHNHDSFKRLLFFVLDRNSTNSGRYKSHGQSTFKFKR